MTEMSNESCTNSMHSLRYLDTFISRALYVYIVLGIHSNAGVADRTDARSRRMCAARLTRQATGALPGA